MPLDPVPLTQMPHCCCCCQVHKPPTGHMCSWRVAQVTSTAVWKSNRQGLLRVHLAVWSHAGGWEVCHVQVWTSGTPGWKVLGLRCLVPFPRRLLLEALLLWLLPLGLLSVRGGQAMVRWMAMVRGGCASRQTGRTVQRWWQRYRGRERGSPLAAERVRGGGGEGRGGFSERTCWWHCGHVHNWVLLSSHDATQGVSFIPRGPAVASSEWPGIPEARYLTHTQTRSHTHPVQRCYRAVIATMVPEIRKWHCLEATLPEVLWYSLRPVKINRIQQPLKKQLIQSHSAPS